MAGEAPAARGHAVVFLQGYGTDAFQRDGMLLLGASPSPDIAAAAAFPFNGRRLTETMEALDRTATMMVILRDESRGRVRRLPGGGPLLTYWMNEGDIRRMNDGVARLGDILQAAGARRIYVGSSRRPVFEGADPVRALRAAPFRPADLTMMSFHPLGTCRMGRDPRRSVVDLDHQAHDLPGLFVVDGSTVPGPPGVNRLLGRPSAPPRRRPAPRA